MANVNPIPGGYQFVIDDARRVEVVKDRGEERYRKDHYANSNSTVASTSVQPKPETGHNVAKDLFNALKICFLNHDNKFVPREEFDRIMTLEAVHQIVPSLLGFRDQSDPTLLAATIRRLYYGDSDGSGQCRKLLGALLVTKCQDQLDNLMQQGMNDDCFPLSNPNQGRLHCQRHKGGHAGLNELPSVLETIVTWSRRLTPLYITWERTSKHRHYLLNEGDPLPMVKVDDGAPSSEMEGGYGEVTRVKMDDSGGKFQDHGLPNTERIYAVKKLKRQGGDDAGKHREVFDLEVLASIYARSRAEGDGASQVGDFRQNIIPLLATFEIRDLAGSSTYYLLFDCAKGNLKDFWKRHNDKREDISCIPWMAKQFSQLIGALGSIHNDRNRLRSDKTWSKLYGRHGDIKPSNFLYFESGGETFLAICDMGLGRLHRDISRLQPAIDIPVTATYRPPECDVSTWSTLLSSKSDIYSMACVFLEHITWYLLGEEALERFAAARLTIDSKYHNFESDIFFTASEDLVTASVKKEVKKWIQELQDHKNCCEYLHKLLDIIEKEMLESDPSKRIGAPELLIRLKKLETCIERSPSFCTEQWKKRSLSWEEYVRGLEKTRRDNLLVRGPLCLILILQACLSIYFVVGLAFPGYDH